MKKEAPDLCEEDRDDMRPEYDFSQMAGGQRGKYYRGYRKGHTVRIIKADGSTVIQHFRLEDGTVVLDPGIREYFPDSDSVNRALRCLIPLMPKKRRSRVGVGKTAART
jgi:hypothetical protein